MTVAIGVAQGQAQRTKIACEESLCSGEVTGAVVEQQLDAAGARIVHKARGNNVQITIAIPVRHRHRAAILDRIHARQRRDIRKRAVPKI